MTISKDISIDDLKSKIKNMSNDILLHEFTSFAIDNVGSMDDKKRSIVYELRSEIVQRMERGS